MAVSDSLKAAVRGRLKGGLWQSPAFQRMTPALDRADAYARHRRGLDALPPYSMRIRSNGVEGQFGGVAFARLGESVVDTLEQYAGLDASSAVVDIGCGVGRVALALARRHPALDYVGLDVDRVSIEYCKSSPCPVAFDFIHIDVATDLYNEAGGTSAETYVLPFESETKDVVYLVSVFTHLLADESRNYAKEILRVLKPGGRCAVSTLLLEEEDVGGWTETDGAYIRYPVTPRKMIGHSPPQMSAFFGKDPEVIVRGTWRDIPVEDGPRHLLAQDMLVFAK